MLDFEKIFDDYNKLNQKVWDHDRASTVGASEVFSCIRKVFFDKRCEELDFTPDKDYSERWGAMARGNLIEDYHVVPAMTKCSPKEYRKMLMGDDQETLIEGKNSATLDGLICDLPRDALKKYGVDDIGSSRIVFEVKSIDPNVFLDLEKEIHYGQANVQLGMVREKTDREDLKPNFAVILYVDASFLDDMTVFVVEFNPKVWRSAKIRAESIWKSDDPESFRAEGKYKDLCKFCKWRGECAGTTKDEIPPNNWDNSSIPELDDAIAAYHGLTSDQKDIEAQKGRLAGDIKEFLKAHDLKSYKTKDTGQGISWSFSSGKSKIDKEALAEDDIDLSDYMVKGHGFDVLRPTKTNVK